jgi:Ca-activated chloride channel family protein
LHRVWSLGVLLGATLAVHATTAAPQDSQSQPIFRSGTQAIEVDVRVTDRDGNAVRDLTRDDFVLLDDGVEQAITTATFVDFSVESPVSRMVPDGIEPDVVTNAGAGRAWVILLGGYGLRAREVARRFVETSMGPHDQVAVVQAFGSMSSAQGFTRNRQLLLAAIDRLAPDDPFASSDARTGAMGDPALVGFGVLEELCERLASVGGRRHAVLFFDPPAMWMPGGLWDVGAFMQQRDALRCATRRNLPVFVVSSLGLGTGGDIYRSLSLTEQAAIRVVAEDTGGDAIVNSNNFEEGYARFLRDSDQYYLLGYEPLVEHRDGEFHSLTVRVNRPGLTVRARRGYYAPEPEPADLATSEPGEPGLSEDTLDALRLPLSRGGLTIDLSAAPFRGTDGDGSVLLTAQVRGTDLSLEAGELVEVGYQAMTAEGETTPGKFDVFKLDLSEASRTVSESVGLRFLDWIALTPGRHQVRLAAHQPNGRTGMVVADVEVPDFAKAAVSMSGLVLASALLGEQRTMKEDETLRPVLGAYPTAVRSFSRDDTVTAYVEVYTADGTRPAVIPTIARTSRLSDPQPVPTRQAVGEPGRVGYVATLDLARYQAGDYVLTFEARNGRESATRQVVFSVTP